jgi:RND family efflux transporter MFP subunit
MTDSPSPSSPPTPSRPAALFVRIALPIGIVAAGLVAYGFLSAEPVKPKSPPAKPQAIRTKVRELRAGEFPVVIRSHGVVRPHSEVTLTAQVPGRISRVNPGLEDGAFFAAGEVLLELETADYETAVIAAEAQVARTQAAHALEETRARQARLNWEDLGYQEAPSELVLRLPQVRESKANVDAAQAQLERAKRDLERTRIRAPFEGRVRRRNVGLGQVVGAGTPLASIFTVDFAEVRLPIAGREIRFLNLPETAEDLPVEVELRSATDEESGVTWKARIIRTEGALDESSLDLFAIARVDDPFGRRSRRPPLRIGQPVVGFIVGRVLTNVVALPRAAVRQLDQVLLVDQAALTLKPTTIVPLWSDEQSIVVAASLIDGGMLLATTHLVYAPNGAKVEIIPDIPTAPTKSATNAPVRPGSVSGSGGTNPKP